MGVEKFTQHQSSSGQWYCLGRVVQQDVMWYNFEKAFTESFHDQGFRRLRWDAHINCQGAKEDSEWSNLPWTSKKGCLEVTNVEFFLMCANKTAERQKRTNFQNVIQQSFFVDDFQQDDFA